MSTLNPAPYAQHKGHKLNLSGTHRGNRVCLDCGSIPVGMPEPGNVEAGQQWRLATAGVGGTSLLVRIVKVADGVVSFREPSGHQPWVREAVWAEWVASGEAVRTREGEPFDEEQASASVPVVAVVTGEGVRAVADMVRLIAFRTWGQTGMSLARNFRPTVKAWNELTGQSCRTRAQVGDAADEMIKAIRTERDGK